MMTTNLQPTIALDAEAVRELVLYLENTSEFYAATEPLRDAMKHHLSTGDYDRARVVKALDRFILNHINTSHDFALTYDASFRAAFKGSNKVNRIAAAHELVDSYKGEVDWNLKQHAKAIRS